MRSALLYAFAEAARSLGLDPYHMLRRAGLPVAALEQPDYPIPVDRVQALLADCAESAASEEFGLLVGLAFKLSMKGPLGLLMREQPDVHAALGVLQRYLRYQNDNVEVRTERRVGGLVVILELVSARTRASTLMNDMSVAMYVQVFRGLLGEDWSPKCIAFMRTAPADPSAYRALSDQVKFGHTENGFFLTETDLAQPLAADTHMAGEIARYLESVTPAVAATAAEVVGALIQRLLPEGDCSVDRVAQHLGVDRRTVHRRLAAEGKSFSELLEATRREIAERRLAQTDQPLGQMALVLGFSSLSTFSRWFRHAHGVQPSEFRRSARAA